MRKFWVFIISIFLTGCTNAYWTGIWETELKNNSSYTVNFYISNNESKIYELKKGESITTEMTRNDKPVMTENKRIDYNYNFNKRIAYYTFEDMKAYKIGIYNSSNEKITVYELNNMLGENYGDSIEVSPKETIFCNLYTTSPQLYYEFTENKFPANSAFISIVYL